MSTSCAYCGGPYMGSCKYCGRPACREHLRSGVCTVCSMALCRVCGGRLSVARCVSCGALACKECLVELDNVRRICVTCASKGVSPTYRAPTIKRIARVSEAAKEWLRALSR